MKKLLFTLLLGASIRVGTTAYAQSEPVAFWGKEEAYLLKQAAQMYKLTDQALTENPPVVGAPTARKLALYNLDATITGLPAEMKRFTTYLSTWSPWLWVRNRTSHLSTMALICSSDTIC